jgi:hypothetical protein
MEKKIHFLYRHDTVSTAKLAKTGMTNWKSRAFNIFFSSPRLAVYMPYDRRSLHKSGANACEWGEREQRRRNDSLRIFQHTTAAAKRKSLISPAPLGISLLLNFFSLFIYFFSSFAAFDLIP